METSKRDRNKEERRQKMIEAAASVYSEKGIDDTTIQEVADRAGLGVASVYRYFPGKADLAVGTAIHIWRTYMLPLSSKAMEKMKSFHFISAYMEGFLELFENHPEVLRFIENFDNYISRQENRPEGFSVYEKLLTEQDTVVTKQLTRGQEEGFIRKDIDVARYYSVATKAIMAMAQKLLLRGTILSSDGTDGAGDLKILIGIMLDSITDERQRKN